MWKGVCHCPSCCAISCSHTEGTAMDHFLNLGACDCASFLDLARWAPSAPSEWNQTDLGTNCDDAWRSCGTSQSCCSRGKRVASVMAVLCGWVCWFGWDFCCAVFCATDAGRSDDWRNYLARWKLGRGKCCRAWVEVFFKIRSSCPSFIQNMTSEIF